MFGKMYPVRENKQTCSSQKSPPDVPRHKKQTNNQSKKQTSKQTNRKQDKKVDVRPVTFVFLGVEMTKGTEILRTELSELAGKENNHPRYAPSLAPISPVLSASRPNYLPLRLQEWVCQNFEHFVQGIFVPLDFASSIFFVSLCLFIFLDKWRAFTGFAQSWQTQIPMNHSELKAKACSPC